MHIWNDFCIHLLKTAAVQQLQIDHRGTWGPEADDNNSNCLYNFKSAHREINDIVIIL